MISGDSFFRDAVQNVGGMAFGFDEGPDVLDFAGLADEEGAACDAHESAAHELFLLPGAEFLDGFVGGIAKQGEIQIVLSLERRLGFNGIGAHAEDSDAVFVETFFCVAKLGRFDGSTGSVGLWVEEEEDAPAGEVFERDGFVFVGFQAEGRGFGAGFEHEKFLASNTGSLSGIAGRQAPRQKLRRTLLRCYSSIKS
jgi:hypothetical protein